MAERVAVCVVLIVAVRSNVPVAIAVPDAGAVVPVHAHANEEFGIVLRGSLELRHGHQALLLRAGEAFLLAGGLEHGARAGDDGCELVECYAPPR